MPSVLASRAAAARRARVQANRSASCGTCPSGEAAACLSFDVDALNPVGLVLKDEIGGRASHEQLARTLTASRSPFQNSPGASMTRTRPG